MSSLRSARLISALTFLPLAAAAFHGCGSPQSDGPQNPPDTGGTGGSTGGEGGKAAGGSGGRAAGGAGGGKATGGTGGQAAGGTGGQATGGASGGAGGSGGTTTNPDGGPPPGDASTVDLPKFSFFVTSFDALKKLSKNDKGFGGNLKYGQTSGLAGADKICAEIADSVMPGASAKGWRAFLSAKKGLNGTPENAMARIGEGPWYDRKGRLLAMSKADLPFVRPRGADTQIANDFPNEHGINNSRPNPGGPEEDNHHFLTGSNRNGEVDGDHTCDNWETNETTAANPPRTGFSFVISNRRHWYYGQVEGGCGAGFDIDGSGPANPSIHHVGSGGGYGGFYCFALKP